MKEWKWVILNKGELNRFLRWKRNLNKRKMNMKAQVEHFEIRRKLGLLIERLKNESYSKLDFFTGYVSKMKSSSLKLKRLRKRIEPWVKVQWKILLHLIWYQKNKGSQTQSFKKKVKKPRLIKRKGLNDYI